MAAHIFGIRHHGPGSARSLLAALHKLQPDAVLIEGPPEAESLLPLLANEATKPPIALLLYAVDDPSIASFYPQAVFSPEWQAIQFAAGNKLPVRFIDLPQGIHFARTKQLLEEAKQKLQALPHGQEEQDQTNAADDQPATQDESASDQQPASEPGASPSEPPIYDDPLTWLAKAAGFADGESWWEHMVELRSDPADLFAAISEAMTALRADLSMPGGEESLQREQWREAHMRQCIRSSEKEFKNIAVICGAWHVPALETMPAAKDDAAVLKGRPKLKVSVTCIPWTHGRLAANSGYRAGVESPGWYHHLWTSKDQTLTRWMVKTARLLRKEDLDASSAHIIESVRLAEALASMRDRPFPSLTEINDATLAVLCHGNSLPLHLIHRKLTVGELIGSVPEDSPRVPLQQDVIAQQKRARLKADPVPQDLDLDLRNETDLLRSLLLHRVGVLGIPWGDERKAQRVKGTFHELWHVVWEPEFEITLIERASWGNTLLAAASAYMCHLANEAPNLPALTGMLQRCLPADLPNAAARVIARVQEMAAVSGDVFELMAAIPPLANIVRYGNVRDTDTSLVSTIVRGLVTRICIGLPIACASLNDDAAQIAVRTISAVHAAVGLLQVEEMTGEWNHVLLKLADQSGLHGAIAGRCTRFLLQAGVLSTEAASRNLSLALSRAADPAYSANWCEGFLEGSGILLVNDEALWRVVDEWISGLTEEHFQQQLPILRRTFSTFQSPERRALGERVRHGGKAQALPARANIDITRARRTLPMLAQLLGLAYKDENEDQGANQ